MKLGAAIKKIRKNKFPETKQQQFAEMVGITQTYLSQIENDKAVPTIKILENISSTTGMPIGAMFFLGMEDADVSADKKEIFNSLKPKISELINSFF